MTSSTDEWKRYGIALALLFVLVYLALLNVRPLFIPDEVRYAEIPREILAHGNWVSPHLNGVRYFEKPPLGYWVNALSMSLLGENSFAVRLPSALATGLTALFIFILLRSLTGRNATAVAGSIIYLSFLEVFFIGTFNTLDSLFTCLLTGGFTAYFLASYGTLPSYRKVYLLILTGVFFGLAFLAKGFLAVVLPILVIVPFLFWENRWHHSPRRAWIPVLAAGIIIAPWAIMVHIREPDFWRYFFWEQHINRFFSGDGQHPESLWFFIKYFLLLAFPWSLQIPALARGLWGSKDNVALIRYLTLWFILPFIFFSSSSGKLLSYILPCFAPLAMLMALGLERAFNLGQKRLFYFGAYLVMFLLMAAMVYLPFSQLFSVEPRLFDAAETWKWLGLWVAVIICFFCVWRSVTLAGTLQRVFSQGFGFLMLAAVFPFIVPNAAIEYRAPGAFMRTFAPLITPDTLLLTHGALIHSVNWFLNRDDVYLISPGELEYGLSYPDVQDRYLIGNTLKNFRRNYDGKRPIAIFLTEWNDKTVGPTLPARAHRKQRGRFVFWYIPPRGNGPATNLSEPG